MALWLKVMYSSRREQAEKKKRTREHKKMLKRIFLIFSCALLLSGCEFWRQMQYEPEFVMNFYQRVYYPGQTEMIERELVNPIDGKNYWVNGNQFFDSRFIEEIRIVPEADDPNMCKMQFKLNRPGMARWTSMSGLNRGKDVIITLDGEMIGMYKQELRVIDDKENWVECDALFDVITAQAIQSHAVDNFRYYNPEAASWF